MARRSASRARTNAAGALDGFLAFFQWFRDTPWMRRVLMAVDVVGVAYGFLYYGPQFAVTPPWLWPFVPDSPLAVLWALLALALLELGRESSALDALAIVGNAFIGLWTAWVLLFERTLSGASPLDFAGFYRADPLNFVLFWAHLAMVAHALAFVRPLALRSRASKLAGLAVAAAYYGANWWLDYAWNGWSAPPQYGGCQGLHPITINFPNCEGLSTIELVTAAMTLFWLALAAAVVLAFPRARAPA
jgi:uncharacterized membrane protein YpjA